LNPKQGERQDQGGWRNCSAVLPLLRQRRKGSNLCAGLCNDLGKNAQIDVPAGRGEQKRYAATRMQQKEQYRRQAGAEYQDWQ
jgi:hypothetical protein